MFLAVFALSLNKPFFMSFLRTILILTVIVLLGFHYMIL